METAIWLVVILIAVVTLVLTLVTSVSKWSNKAVTKYVKDEEQGLKKDIQNNPERYGEDKPEEEKTLNEKTAEEKTSQDKEIEDSKQGGIV